MVFETRCLESSKRLLLVCHDTVFMSKQLLISRTAASMLSRVLTFALMSRSLEAYIHMSSIYVVKGARLSTHA